MAADAMPDDVPLAPDYLLPIGPSGAAVAVPGQLEDAVSAPRALHAEAGAEASVGAQVVNEGGDGPAEAAALFCGEAI